MQVNRERLKCISGIPEVLYASGERRARPKDQQDARRVCRSCYKAAVKAEQEASVPLPGTVDIFRCELVTAVVRKCSVCGLERAA